MTSLTRLRVHALFVDTHVSGRASSREHRAHRAKRTRSACWRWVCLIAAAAMASAALSGCASVGQPRVVEYDYENQPIARPGHALNEAHPRFATPPADPNVNFDAPDADVSPAAHALAQQSQRDVEMLLEASQSRGAMTSTSQQLPSDGIAGTADDRGSVHGSAMAAPQRTIIWNDGPSLSDVPAAAPSTQPLHGASSASLPPAASNASDTAHHERTPLAALSTGTDDAGAAHDADAVIDVALLRPDRIRQLIVDLSRELYAEGAYSAHPLRELAIIAALSMHDQQRRLDPAAIPDLTEDERQVLAGLQSFFTTIGERLGSETSVSSNTSVSNAVAEAAATLRQSLVHEPVLKLPTAALCTRVGGFGDYTPFEKYAFLAATEQKAIVYLEIGDFVSEINQYNEYVTEISQQLTIYGERDGIPVWKEDWLTATDVTRNKRQDFFTTQIIALPKALGVGRYILKIRVRDEKSKAESETSITFELIADPKLLR